MEILKYGSDPKLRIYDATCNHCKTEVRFKSQEAVFTSDQRDGDYYTVICPVCKMPITADASRFNKEQPPRPRNI